MNWTKNFNYPRIRADFGDGRLVKKDLQAFLYQSIEHYNWYELEQTHSNKVEIIEKGFAKNSEADAMVTAQIGNALVIRTADCFPVLFYDPEAQIIGAAHSGREGTRKNIVQEVIRAMQSLGANAENISAAVGPGISADCYEVDADTWKAFCEHTRLEQKYRYLDIRSVIHEQLLVSGIQTGKIYHQNICTCKADNYHSWRESKTSFRQYNWIMMF